MAPSVSIHPLVRIYPFAWRAEIISENIGARSEKDGGHPGRVTERVDEVSVA